MASVIDSMEDLGKAADKSTEALQRTAVAMAEVGKKAFAMAKSVSTAIRELVKMTLVAKGMVKAILSVVVGMKILVNAVSQAITVFGEWVKTIAKSIASLFGLDFALIKVSQEIFVVVDSINQAITVFDGWVKTITKSIVSLFGLIFAMTKVSQEIFMVIDSINQAIFAFDAWIRKIVLTIGLFGILGGVMSKLTQKITDVCNELKIFEETVVQTINTTISKAIELGAAIVQVMNDVGVAIVQVVNDVEVAVVQLVDDVGAAIVRALDDVRSVVDELGDSVAVALDKAKVGIYDVGVSIMDVIKNIIDVIQLFGLWTKAGGPVNDMLEDLLDFLGAISLVIEDMYNNGLWDGGWFDVFGSDANMNVNKYVNIIPLAGSISGQTASMLSGISGMGLNPAYRGNTSNTTNITYNVRTTKDMSLRNAERERRLYSR